MLITISCVFGTCSLMKTSYSKSIMYGILLLSHLQNNQRKNVNIHISANSISNRDRFNRVKWRFKRELKLETLLQI